MKLMHLSLVFHKDLINELIEIAPSDDYTFKTAFVKLLVANAVDMLMPCSTFLTVKSLPIFTYSVLEKLDTDKLYQIVFSLHKIA